MPNDYEQTNRINGTGEEVQSEAHEEVVLARRKIHYS